MTQGREITSEACTSQHCGTSIPLRTGTRYAPFEEVGPCLPTPTHHREPSPAPLTCPTHGPRLLPDLSRESLL